VVGTACALLRDARAGSGLSRSALAAKAGVPTSTVSRIEDEQTDPTVATLERLLSAAGVRLVAEPTESTPTLASLATAVSRDRRLRIDWTRLRGFADWAERHRADLAAAIADPPARTGSPLDPILAAFAEQLALEHGIERPRWTRAVGPLPKRWSPPLTPRVRGSAEATTPEPFRRRNIVIARSALFRREA
jgi:transcriptional regulator with XRE-family HTH domain